MPSLLVAQWAMEQGNGAGAPEFAPSRGSHEDMAHPWAGVASEVDADGDGL